MMFLQKKRQPPYCLNKAEAELAGRMVRKPCRSAFSCALPN